MRSGSLRPVAVALGSLLWAGPAWAAGSPAVAPPHAGIECAACHPQGTGPGARSTCATKTCHAAQAAELRDSEHDRRHLTDARTGPGCADCHGGHRMENPASTACEKQLDSVCLQCHPAGRYVGLPGDTPRPAGLADSIHTRVRETAGCASASLTCYACHGAHTVRPLSSSDSPAARSRVADTCGRCHPKQRESFQVSAHAQGLAGGSTLA
ncbi:MAG TPA: cytochrome c3 family protein, partial [Vicinamibacteria bacterium]|nr:cytochrome c3 family protein [Vicinamibacteria bacterium]